MRTQDGTLKLAGQTGSKLYFEGALLAKQIH